MVDRLADVGYVPELGAKELKRKIQTEIETPLAKEILSGNMKPGGTVQVGYDSKNNKVTFNKQPPKREGKPLKQPLPAV